MTDEPSRNDSSLTERMVARIEIEELGDPVRETKITDAVAALRGVVETSTENGALHVLYDPLSTSEEKIEQAVRSAGGNIKYADTDTQTPRP